MLNSLRRWIQIALVVAVAAFLFIHFVLKPSPEIKLPTGQTIKLDTSSFNKAVNQILKKQNEQGKKLNDLESSIRQQQSHLVEEEIPSALKQKDIRKSVEIMLNAW